MTDTDTDTDRDNGALAWARELAIGNCLFGQLAVGERFRFAASPVGESYVRTATGYRLATGGRTWRTGSRSAVFRLPVEN